MKRFFSLALIASMILMMIPTTGCMPTEVEQTNKQLKITAWTSDEYFVEDTIVQFSIQHPDVEIITDF